MINTSSLRVLDAPAHIGLTAEQFQNVKLSKREKACKRELRRLKLNSQIVVNRKVVKFKDGEVYLSGSTGNSREYKVKKKEIESKYLSVEERRAKKAEKRKNKVATGDCRRRVVSNAMQEATLLAKVLIGKAEELEQKLWMVTWTFNYHQWTVDQILESMKAVNKIFPQRCAEFLTYLGIGTGKNKKKSQRHGKDNMGEPPMTITRNRVALHAHTYFYGNDNVYQEVVDALTSKGPNAGLPYNVYSVTTQLVDDTEKPRLAQYAANNIEVFKPWNLRKLVDDGIYTQDAIDELLACQKKIKLYRAGGKTNYELTDCTTKNELPVEDNGQDATNQALLEGARETNAKIEKMHIVTEDKGQKHYASYSKVTKKAYRRALKTIPSTFIRGKSKLPHAFYRAWTLYKEADYMPSKSFLEFVMANPNIREELEDKRRKRRR